MTYNNLRIHRIFEKNLLNFRCELGHSKLVQATSEGDLYCLTCKRVEASFQTSYKLQLHAVYMDKLENFVLYNASVEMLMGCTSDQFHEHMKMDASLLEKLEYELRNRYCNITQRGKKQQRTKTNVIIGDKIELSPPAKLIDLILDPTTRYDETLELLTE
ncbi:hypothetical protein K501DRAFT_307279 [Backusella circina FSU 941]|nr:hypothetical protein K501DRAFT_307279 [Backusella circina FSU 941]